MTKHELRFELLSPWVVASGRSGGPQADSLILRTPGGLPYLPGRSVKGLLRDASQQAEGSGLIEAGTTERLFGTWSHGEGVPGRYETSPGQLSFSDARLPSSFEDFAREGEGGAEWAESFVMVQAATAIDEDGLAADKTLRAFESAVPMALQAWVEGPEESGAEAWSSRLAQACCFVRALGAHRSRGYGRVQVQLRLSAPATTA